MLTTAYQALLTSFGGGTRCYCHVGDHYVTVNLFAASRILFLVLFRSFILKYAMLSFHHQSCLPYRNYEIKRVLTYLC